MHPADRFPRWTAGPGERTRANLEARLLPLVRRALRTRTGLPALVGWVDRSLAVLEAVPPPDPDRAARGLTRLLCDVLMQPPGPRPGAETVCGP
jgi:hypothetical protein